MAGATSPTVSTITYGGTSMGTAVGSVANTTAGSVAFMYSRVAPPASSQTIAVTFDQASYGACGSSSFTDVDQVTPDGTAATNTVNGGGRVSATAPGVTANDIVHDVL